jgi:carboxypeptidase T
MDFAYGLLGVAAFSFELGDSFYQDCNTFENSIIPQNFPSLTYLAKIARAPFHISKGPDITRVSAVVKRNNLIVNVTASDSALSYGDVGTSKQSISRIRVFIDTHPYSVTPSKGYVLKSGNGVIDVSNLTPQSRHVVYAEATDSAGYKGAVKATYFSK